MNPVARSHASARRRTPPLHRQRQGRRDQGAGRTDRRHRVLFDHRSARRSRQPRAPHRLPVNDRTMVILEIFAQRARSHEGKLQVELARLQYVSTRLVRRWSHLERQTGGAGVRGGPGEKQIELDRRMIGESIKRTKERLVKLKKQRQTQRRQRERQGAFTISLVGYTNAGKSTLFNALVKARAYAATSCSPRRHHHPPALSGESAEDAPPADARSRCRTRSLHPRPAARPGCRLPGHAPGGGGCRLLLHVVDAANPAIRSRWRKCSACCRRSVPAPCADVVFNKIDLRQRASSRARRATCSNSTACWCHGVRQQPHRPGPGELRRQLALAAGRDLAQPRRKP